MTKLIKIFTKHHKAPLLILPWEQETFDVITKALSNICNAAEIQDSLIQIINEDGVLIMWASEISIVIVENSETYDGASSG